MAREPKADSRHYLIDGERVVRVSTVLSVISKPGLMFWYGKWGMQECRRQSQVATDFGTRFHKCMELHAQGSLLPWDIDPDIAPHVDSARRWFDRHVAEVVAIERRVHSRRHGFAGTADLIARLRDVEGVPEDVPVACDWKTSKDIAWEYGLQLSAYLEASREEGHPIGDDRVVLWAPREPEDRPLGSFEARVLPRDEHAEDWAAFLHARGLWTTFDARERRAKAAWAARKRAAERNRRLAS